MSWTGLENACEVFSNCADFDASAEEAVTSSINCEVCEAHGFCLGPIVAEVVVEGRRS